MKLVNVVAGGLASGPVDGDAVPNLVLDDQHPQLFQLLAQLLDVIADNAVVDVHVGPVIEHIQTAGDVDFQRRGDEMGLLFLLFQQKVIQVLQDGHILRPGVGQIVPVDQPDAAVNDGLFHRLQPVLAAHHNVAEGQQEIHLQRQRAFIVRIVQVEVHRIDVLLAGGGNLDNLSLQPVDQGKILRLRVTDNDVVICNEENIEDFPLCAETLTTSGSAKD